MRNWVHYLKHYRPAHRNWRDSWRRSYWSREQYFGGGSYQTFSGYRLTRRSRGKSSSVGSLRPGYLNCIGLETKQAVSKLKELTACKLLNLVQIGHPDLSFHKITNKWWVLAATRYSRTVTYQDAGIMCFQNLSATILQERKDLTRWRGAWRTLEPRT